MTRISKESSSSPNRRAWAQRLVELLQLPSLNIRGLRRAYVTSRRRHRAGEGRGRARLCALVKGETRQEIRAGAGAHSEASFHVTSAPPTRRAPSIRVSYVSSTTLENLSRFTNFHGVARFKSARSARARYYGGKCVVAPTLAAACRCIFSKTLVYLGLAAIVNYDNHQHSSDENLRLGNFGAGW